LEDTLLLMHYRNCDMENRQHELDLSAGAKDAKAELQNA